MPHAVRTFALFTALLSGGVFPAFPQQGASNGATTDHQTRELTGTVTDPHHEPLRGVVVKLQEGDTSNIITYITGDDGRYRFRRLNGNIDYRVWVTFREKSSKPKSISKFDTNMDKVLDFSIEAF